MLNNLFLPEFPRKPVGVLKQHIADEADGRLAFYLPPPEDIPVVEGQPEVQKHELPPGVFDAPLVRLYNFLRKLPLPFIQL